MPFQPNARFCNQARIDHPADESVWHPREFTFKSLRETLFDLAAHDVIYGPLPYTALMAHSPKVARGHERMAALVVPVALSPSNALSIAESINAAAADLGTTIRATFLFGADQPSYQLADYATVEASRILTDAGHDIGLLVNASNEQMVQKAHDELDEVIEMLGAFSGKRVAAAGFWNPAQIPADTSALEAAIEQRGLLLTHTPFLRNGDHCVTFSTDHGVYTGGNPVKAFGEQVDTSPLCAIVSLTDYAFSPAAEWPVNRLVRLPEIKGNPVHESRVATGIVHRLEAGVLGQNGTTEPLADYEFRRMSNIAAQGFGRQRHEISG